MFDTIVANMPDIKKLFDWMKYQNLEHLFELLVPQLHEKEVRMFYHNLTIFDDGLHVIS